MASKRLFDTSGIDPNHLQLTVEDIEALNPHRGDIRMLDGINYLADDFTAALGFKNVRDDEFWVPGHIPGRPLFPGVLMLEAAAQIASVLTMRRLPEVQFLGFVGVDDCKFRGQVVPGDRLDLLNTVVDIRPRRAINRAQGWVGDNLVFEATIIGMPI